MQRLFGQIVDGFGLISDSDAHHLVDVKRFKVGEELEFVSDGTAHQARIVSVNPLKIQVIGEIAGSRECPAEVILGFALLKGDHNDLIVEKCTELGASRFVPMLTDRTIIKADLKDDSKRIGRLSKIVKGAAEQSRRDLIPTVEDTLSFKDALKIQADVKLIAYEEKAGSSDVLTKALQGNGIKSVFVLVGPEGGFTAKEVEMAKNAGFAEVSLGKRILRGETAFMFAVGAVAALLEGSL